MSHVSVNGGRAWYEIRGDGPGRPLLLLHGGPGFSSLSFETVSDLGKYRPLIFYDQLGSYRSDHPGDPSLWRLDRFVEELDTLIRTLNLGDLHILGHSWGTMLLAAYLKDHPGGVRSAVFSGPALDARRWARDQDAYRTALPEAARQALAEAEREPSLREGKAYQEAMDLYYHRHVCRLDPWPEILNDDFTHANLAVYETMWGPAEFTATGNLKDYDATPWLGQIGVPALFTCGAFDEATPETTAHYRSLLPGAELHVFGKSSHMAMVEEPVAYRDVIGDFVARHD